MWSMILENYGPDAKGNIESKRGHVRNDRSKCTSIYYLICISLSIIGLMFSSFYIYLDMNFHISQVSSLSSVIILSMDYFIMTTIIVISIIRYRRKNKE